MLALVLAAVSVVPGCSDDPPEPPPEGARSVTITTDAGSDLDAVELGSGDDVVVLSHGASGTKEDFYELAQAFADAGWRAIAYDSSGVGGSTGVRDQDREGDLRAVVEHARVSDVGSLVLGGGSIGASLSIAMAGTLEANAVIALSPPAEAFGALQAATELGGDVPLHVVAAAGNEPFPDEARRLAAVSGTKATIVDGSGHGTGVLSDHPELIDEIVAFAVEHASDTKE
jgi:pimeloyl-ACP methyl ester carboxylesterase